MTLINFKNTIMSILELFFACLSLMVVGHYSVIYLNYVGMIITFAHSTFCISLIVNCLHNVLPHK